MRLSRRRWNHLKMFCNIRKYLSSIQLESTQNENKLPCYFGWLFWLYLNLNGKIEIIILYRRNAKNSLRTNQLIVTWRDKRAHTHTFQYCMQCPDSGASEICVYTSCFVSGDTHQTQFTIDLIYNQANFLEDVANPEVTLPSRQDVAFPMIISNNRPLHKCSHTYNTDFHVLRKIHHLRSYFL